MISTNVFTLAKAKYFGGQFTPVCKIDPTTIEINFEEMVLRVYFDGNRDTPMEVPLYFYNKDLPYQLYIMKKSGEEVSLSDILEFVLMDKFTIMEPVWWTSPLSGDSNEMPFYPEIINSNTNEKLTIKKMTISRLEKNDSIYLARFLDNINREFEEVLVKYDGELSRFRNSQNLTLYQFLYQIDTSLNRISLIERNV